VILNSGPEHLNNDSGMEIDAPEGNFFLNLLITVLTYF